MPRLRSALWAATKLAAIAGVCALGSCTAARTILKTAPTERPVLTASDTELLPMGDEQALRVFERSYYGPVRAPLSVKTVSSSEHEFSDEATLTQFQLRLAYPGGTRTLLVAAVMPDDDPGADVIVSQNFCPTQDVLPSDALPPKPAGGFDCAGGGPFRWLMTGVFGRHIVEPPINDILARGFGFVAMYPSEVVPDSARAGSKTLSELFPDDFDRPGALAVWAGLHDAVAGVLTDRFGERQMIAYGHSRYGKTALMAGAWFDSVDGVIAHQSGTLGASDVADDVGEPLVALVRSYPHWGRADLVSASDRTARMPRPALVLRTMEKPVLLGNARRDVWSDPVGAWREGHAAWGDAFAESPGAFDAASEKAFWLRPGTHGVTKEDWEAFLAWAEANFSE